MSNNICKHLRKDANGLRCGRANVGIYDIDFYYQYCAVKGDDDYCTFAEKMGRG